MKSIEERKGKIVGKIVFHEKFPTLRNSEDVKKFGWKVRADVHFPSGDFYNIKVRRNKTIFDAAHFILNEVYEEALIPKNMTEHFVTYLLQKNTKQITFREFEVKKFIDQEHALELLEA